MTDTPPEWVLIEAAKRCVLKGELDAFKNIYEIVPAYRVVCDMIQKYEQPPVNRKLLCAREAYRNWCELKHKEGLSMNDYISIRAIELWEEGFGK